MLTRTPLLAVFSLAGCLAIRCAAPSESPGPSSDDATSVTEGIAWQWQWSDPAAEGLDAAPLEALHEAIEAGDYGNIDRMVVVRNGKLVISERYPRDYREISRGHDSYLGCGWETCDDDRASDPHNYFYPEMHPYHRGREIHTQQSVTKSVVASVVGIALLRGELQGLDAKLLPFFDDYDLSAVDERLHDATLDDVLTMRTGISWQGPLAVSLVMEHSDDWIQFTLSRPSDAAPGDKWVYNDGASHLLSGVIRRATGLHLDAYAEEHLFDPLRITDYYWKKTPSGYADAEGGLYLDAEDLARIGQLYLQDGTWNGRRILAEGWVDAATTEHVERVDDSDWGYGYQWWVRDRRGVEIWAGRGFGGQLLYVLPAYDLVSVMNGWNVFGGGLKIRDAFLDALIDSLLPG